MHAFHSLWTAAGFVDTVFCLWAVAFAAIAVGSRKDPKAYGFAFGALASTIAVLGWGAFCAWVTSYRDVRDFSWPDIDPMIRLDALTSAFTKSDPIAQCALGLGLVAAVVSCAAVVADWHKCGAFGRVAAMLLVVVTVALAFPAGRLAHRGDAIHREYLAWHFDAKRVGVENPQHCDNLEDGIQASHDIAEAESIVPDLRARAKACITGRLACLDSGGECAKERQNTVEVYGQLHPGKHTTPLQHFVAESPLLIDADQKQDVARRVAQEQGLSAAAR